jgi:hypothetical protein
VASLRVDDAKRAGQDMGVTAKECLCSRSVAPAAIS